MSSERFDLLNWMQTSPKMSHELRLEDFPNTQEGQLQYYSEVARLRALEKAESEELRRFHEEERIRNPPQPRRFNRGGSRVSGFQSRMNDF